MRARLLLILAILVLVAAPPVLAAKDYVADRYDVGIAVQEDGSVVVTEKFDFRFIGGPFTKVFRELRTAETGGVTDIAASMDGRALPEGSAPGQVEISHGRKPDIQWHMSPTSDSSHSFTLQYRLLDAIRQESDADVLSIYALPVEHDYPIASSLVTVSYPPAAGLMGEPQVVAGKAIVDTRQGQASFRSSDISPDESLRIVMRFAPGSLISAPPQWQVQERNAARLAPWWIILSTVIVAAGIAALFAYQRRYARLPVTASALSVMRPPSDLPPAMAGLLKDGSPDPQWAHALGTLLDLGRRGLLVIEEVPKTSRWRGQDFLVRLVAQPSALLPHEDGLLRLCFEGKNGATDATKISDLSSAMSSRWKVFADPLKQEAHDAGYFDPKRERVRRNMMGAGGLLLIAGSVVFFLAIPFVERAGPAAFLVGGAIFAVGLIGLIMGGSFSAQSDTAAQQGAQWQAFARYLKDVAKGKQPAVSARLLEDYLADAASLGLAEDWAKLFKQREGDDVLAWFRPLTTSPDSMGSFVAMIAATSSAGGSSGAGSGQRARPAAERAEQGMRSGYCRRKETSMENKPETPKDDPQSKVGTWLGVGVGVGLALGTALGAVAMGLALGAALGTAFGAALDANNKRQNKK